MKGTVKRWLSERGYGFIEPDEGGEEVFLHHSEMEGTRCPDAGERVEFEVRRASKGPQAVGVKIIE